MVDLIILEGRNENLKQDIQLDLIDLIILMV